MTHIAPISNRSSWIQDDGRPTQVFWDFIRLLWIRTGGPENAIENIEITELDESRSIGAAFTETVNQLHELEQLIQEKDSRIEELENDLKHYMLMLS